MLEWFISSAALTALVIALRYALRGKISLRLQYALWALALLRLLIPVSFGASRLSVQNILPEPEAAAAPATTPSAAVLPPKPLTPASPAPVTPPPEEVEVRWSYSPYHPIGDLTGEADGTGGQETPPAPVDTGRHLRLIWFAVACLTLLWLLLVNLHFALRLRRSRRPFAAPPDCPLPVYVTEAAETPCLFGLFRPAVYLTPQAAEDPSLDHILAHEYTHYRHGDQVWSLLRGVTLALHWFDPLVWWAAALSRRDGELACDEGTLRRLGEEERSAYGYTLLRMTAARRPDLLRAATTMTGSKRSLRERIKLIARKPKTALLALFALILIAALGAACTFTGAKGRAKEWTDAQFISRAWPLAEKYAKTNGLTIDKEIAAVLRYAAGDQAEVAFPEAGGDRSLVVGFLRSGDGGWQAVAGGNAVTLMERRAVELAPRVRGSNPEEVLELALAYTRNRLAFVTEVLGLRVTSARLTGLTPLGTGAAGLTEGWDLYRLEYRFRLAEPEKAVLPQGMRLEGDELTEWSERGQPFLLLRWEVGELTTGWSLLCATDTAELESVYHSPEETCNDWLRAGAELYASWLETQQPELDPLAVLTGLEPEDAASVSCRFYASTASGTVFTLTREEHPEEVAGLVGMFSHDPRDYSPLGSDFSDYSPDYAVTFLDASGRELVTVYVHDTLTVSFGDRLYWCGEAVSSYPFNLAWSVAKRDGSYTQPQPWLTVSCGERSVQPIIAMRWEETWTGSGWLSADGAPEQETLRDYEDRYEQFSLTRVGEVSLTFSREVSPGSPVLRVYDENLHLLEMYWEDPEGVLAALGPGTYWCGVVVVTSGEYVPEAGRSPSVGYECLFRLVVPDREEIRTVTDNPTLYTLPEPDLAPEEAAFRLAGLMLEDLRTQDPARTYRIIEYRDLGVEVFSTAELLAAADNVYNLREEMIGENTWIVEIRARFRWEGTLSPLGPSEGDRWADQLYQGGPYGFLLTRTEDGYTLQSRYYLLSHFGRITAASDLDLLRELSGFSSADWDRAVQSGGFPELSRRLLESAVGEDQAQRDVFVMSAVLHSDGAYAELLAEALRLQYEADPHIWAEALRAFTAKEADLLRQLAEYPGEG